MTRPYIKRLSFTLLDSITDKDPVVQEQVCSALCSLGDAQPDETLHACEEYLRQHDKLAHPYRTKILRAMETVLTSHIHDVDKDTAGTVILLASSEMTRTKELDCDWQQAASSILVAVGKRFTNQVMEEVLSRFQPGMLPHSSVLHTLANLSVSNAFDMVPFLPSILSTMLPMLGMAKQDALKVVFCCALQHFSESILEYLANLDQAPDPTVRKDTFGADIFGAYDVLFHHWLQSRDTKLRLAVVAALGPMSHLLPSERLEEQLPKLLPAVLGLYKKHADTFQISKSLGQILEAAVNVSSRTLEVQLDALLAALHAQICVPVESSSPLVMNSQKEVLRCFTVLAGCSPDRLLAFLLPRLDTSNERLRVGTLQILRHIINSAAAQMEAKKPFILSSMRQPLLDTNDKVKRAVVQVISAMAHHGYLEQPGGEGMVDYIVQQCALPAEEPEKPGPDGEELAADSVRAVSIRTLYLVSTTVDRMNSVSVLWPYLLEFLTPVRFTAALTPLCRSLVHLALKRQEAGAEDLLLQYNSNANLPSPFALTTRLLVVSSNPYLGDGRGAASLRLLKVMHQNIHPLLGQRWETTMPVLLEYLDEHTEETLSLKEWEEKLLVFLRDTLAVVSDNIWICQLSQEMCKQLPSYSGTPQEKNFLYKCIGTTLGAASSKEVVRKHLQELLETARYQEEAEQEGLACCFGICAITHLEDTLAQLEDFVRSDVFRKSTSIFSIFKDRSEHEVERMKSSLILCYGHVAAQAPRELVLARVESDILRSMFQCFNTKVLGIKVETKDPALKLCLVQSLCMVSQAMCSSAQASSFHFSRKAELMAQMTEFIRAEPPDCLRTPIRKKAMLACTYLVNLEPALEEQAQADVIHSCLHSVMALPPEPEGEDGICQEPLYQDTVCALEDLLTSLLRQNMTPQGLQIMVEHLSPWIKSPRGHERARALGLGACLLEFFLEHLHVSTLVPFHNLGLLVGLFAPRCADTWTTTRQEAVGCVYSLLYLQLGYEGFSRDHRDDVAERLLTLKDGLVHPDPTILFHTCHSIAQVIAKRLPSEQLISLLLTMFESLGDPDKNCSRAATVMINCLLKERGNVLLEKVPEIVSVLRAKLRDTQEEHVLPAAQHSVYLLASQHCEAVVSSLLGSPLPFDSHMCALWRALAVEPSLTAQVLELLLEKMSKDVPFKESRAFLLGSTADRVATMLPLAATCALYEVLSAPSSGTVVLELYPQLFVALLLRVSCTVGVQLPRNLQAKERKSTSPARAARNLDPCSSAVDALQALLLRSGSQDVLRCVELEGGWELLRTSAGHEDGVAQLASSMAKYAGPRLPLVMKALGCTQNSVYEIQRVTSTAFLAELLSSNVVNDLMLLEPLLDNLTARLKDSSASVRRLVLRGLANMASGSPDKVRAHGPQLMTAMVSGLDDGDEPHSLVALEAMVGLSRLLDLVEPWDLRLVLLHTTIRIRPFFDSEKVEFRTASIRLFGHLNKACHGDCEDVFLEQVVGGLVPLLLHLRDPQVPVASACKFALCMCVPHLECAELAAAFYKYLQEGRSVHFGEFLNSTCKHLMHHFPDLLGRLVSTNLFYFKSSWDDVRAAAPMFTGFLVLHAEPEQRTQVDLEQLIVALQLLLKDPVPGVREKAAETLGRLVKFA
ncbi:maestro heat-like repeat-containing protein family member 1 isoform X1 [Grammomys surdaster]|uniref:maestro heat-like repeat-containing protein family member 1 isoform X1 n=1 Tax=Grammomys surdaster TaxID=491861 RepID=UPI0010A02160|nr:maestro heat-like repeat-containing protein family member 1 isoform X1 [Grammomys surdaster]XP_028634698.1 maestro heat-like repeat-containing protein family member 1 isoform X1 [Grammomys surdaster]XP_028634699.1 maestro heat-like repeat-containing protein family member 1 isoform X1 [Grammomys surdaster]XP_028634700.1 maestro heat-like repeat-containing protein family member 1 isoform X1 [Grammomys surdaster]